MASESELRLLLTARDTASTVVRAFAGVMTGAVVGALSDAAKAAAADAADVARLQTAVENTGSAWADSLPLIEAQIKKGQDLAFTDDQVRGALGALVTSTGSLDKALGLLAPAMDIARAKHTDLETASMAVGKASEGNATQLKKLMGIVNDTGSATDALARAQKIAAGQAETYGKSTEASIFKVKDAVDEWKESIGQALGPAQTLVGLLPGLRDGAAGVGGAFSVATPYIVAHAAQLKTLAGVIGKGGIVLIALGLVVEAVDQVIRTVKVVTDEWDKFVYALTNGMLNDIPVFGFFFSKAQQVLGLIAGIQQAWSNLQMLLGNVAAPGGTTTNQGERGSTGGYAEGTDYVPATGYYKLHQGEAVITAAQNRGGGGEVHLHFHGDVYGMQSFEDKVASIFRDRRLAGGFRGLPV